MAKNHQDIFVGSSALESILQLLRDRGSTNVEVQSSKVVVDEKRFFKSLKLAQEDLLSLGFSHDKVVDSLKACGIAKRETLLGKNN
jgi:hypothetical protein